MTVFLAFADEVHSLEVGRQTDDVERAIRSFSHRIFVVRLGGLPSGDYKPFADGGSSCYGTFSFKPLVVSSTERLKLYWERTSSSTLLAHHAFFDLLRAFGLICGRNVRDSSNHEH